MGHAFLRARHLTESKSAIVSRRAITIAIAPASSQTPMPIGAGTVITKPIFMATRAISSPLTTNHCI